VLDRGGLPRGVYKNAIVAVREPAVAASKDSKP